MGSSYAERSDGDHRPGSVDPATVPKQPSAAPAPRGLTVRAKLVVGGAHDPAEHEADRIAEDVVRRLRAGATPGVVDSSSTRIRRAASSRSSGGGGGGGDGGGDGARADAAVSSTRIRRAASASAAGGVVDSDTEQRIRRSQGAPLDGEVRRTMESAFGADFGSVRLHVGGESDALNAQLGARAFTSGSDVFVRRQDYAPGTSAGQRLLAHELTHTLQSGATVARAPDDAAPSAPAVDAGASSDSDSELEAEPGEVVFALAPVTAEGYTMGAEKFQEDRSGRAGQTHSRPAQADPPAGSTGPVALSWESAVATSTSITRDDGAVGRAGDYFKLKEAQLKPTTTQIGNASAFGEMTPSYTFAGLEVAYSKKEGRLRVKGSVEGTYSWGTNSGGMIDVPSPTAGVVTADNYEQIAADLTPALEEKSWRAPRTKYWSEAICARHEKYHAKDEEKWFLKNGTSIIDKYLKAHPITISDDDRKDLPKLKTLAQEAMDATISHLDKESWRFYAGADGTSYCSRPGEIRAFGDGKAPYLKLKSGVTTHGKKLAKAQKKAAATTAPTTAPTS